TEWTIGPSNTEDAYYITNIGRNVYVEWYASKNYWSGYGKITEATEGAFAQMFYLVVEEEEPEPEPAEEGFVSPDDLKDGDQVVVYNRESGVALSQTYDGFYNTGTPVTEADGKLEGYTNADIWTVGVTEGEEGKVYTFSTAEGQKFSMGEQYSSMPLDDVNTEWTIGPSNTEDMYYIKNTGRNVYVEWYAARNYWSGYGKITEATEGAFAQMFYLTKREEEGTPGGGVLNDGDEVVIYNPGAEAVFGPLNDMGNSLTPVAAVINDGYAETENGALVFNVTANDEIYAFETGGKYLATNDAEDVFLSDALSDTSENCTYWTLEAVNDGYVIYSKTAKYKTSAVCIEFFSGYFSGWTYKASTPELFVNQFYPVKEGTPVYNGMVNSPKITFTGADTVIKGDVYEGSFVLDDLRDVELTVTADVDGAELTLEEVKDKEYAFTIGADVTEAASTITVHAKATDPEGTSYEGTFTITVKNEVLFLNNQPAANAETGADKRPVISVEVKNAGEGFTYEMLVKGEKVDAVYNEGVISYTPAEDMADGRTTVNVTVTRADGEVFAKSWSFFVGAATEQLYFGQLHSHTQYSDGSGSLENALEYIANLPENANIDFVAFTDHSNYFDTTSAANPEQALYDMSLASASSQEIWQSYKDATDKFNETHDDLIAISGFEMTWSGGPGHINTFNTPGIVSRNNATLNNKTNDAGMKAYYALLSQNEGIDSLSQFNHPGTTFGTFSDFAYWDAVIDSRMYMVEVGNGEGQIGQGGYYPSYEHYTMALDKGWHLAPTNNQDNHKGRWGNANDARDVILTDDFSEQGIYDAIRAMRMYATEDKNLEIYYSVNDQPLGTTISEVPEELSFKVAVSDPDATDSIAKVELIVNSGKTVYAWEDEKEIQAGDLTVTLSPDYSYYYVRVTEKDGDLAVTAPVWVGETLKLGISSLDCSVAMPVTNEELTLTTTLFNSEAIDAAVKSVVYTVNGSVVIGTDTNGYTLPAGGTLEIPFSYTPTEARVIKVTSTVVLEQDGKEFTYSKDITLDVLDADKLVYIGIDASHHNEYVAGNYKDSMGNFGLLASEYSVRTNQLNTSEDLIAACSNEKYKAIILTAPSRRDGISLRDPYDNYTDDEIAALKQFNADGGMVILAGWSDYYESYAEFPEEDHMSAQQNKVLAALGSKLRISDDGTNDNELNGGQTQRLYFSTYNFDNPLNEGVVVDPENPNDRKYTEVFSHYGGASIYAVDDAGNPTTAVAETISPMVYGHASTYSTNADGCGVGGDAVPKYAVGEGDERLMIMATEQIGEQGLIIVSGAAFMSNFEVQASVASGTSDADQQYNYSNYRICENILKGLNSPVIDTIATVKAVTEEGYKFTIEGIVTSNASGYDKNTAFFDCIYIQDETGGLCIFPVSGNYKVGDRVRVTGTTDWYQGEPELQV
ncbi:MAG: CehA/McbA family metallohydrolase, partial [Solobacterium sp.]|nr:CehA/McbA family metallohydrolase [Solobacterium sp.]